MRINEAVKAASVPTSRILDHAPQLELEHWYELSGLPTVPTGEDERDSDLAVVALGPTMSDDETQLAIESASSRAQNVLVLLQWALHEIPVGHILRVALRDGWQITAVAPIEHAGVFAAVFLSRSSDLLIPGRYLDVTGAAKPTDQALRRLIAEGELTRLSERAQMVQALEALHIAKDEHIRLEAAIAKLTAERDEARVSAKTRERETASAVRERDRIKNSPQMRAGQALVDLKKRPVRGFFGLPKALRAARKPVDPPG